VAPGEYGSAVGLDLLALPAGEVYEGQEGDEELVLVLLAGALRWRCGTWDRQGRRRDVWSDPAVAAYIPPQTTFRLEAEEPCELALCRAPARNGAAPAWIAAEPAAEQWRGRDLFRRRVVDLCTRPGSAERLIVGETFNPAGHWSSYPPHKHDTSGPEETALQEVYFYLLRPAHGFALQALYT